MKTTYKTVSLLAILFVAALLPEVCPAAEPTSIEEFNRQSKNWERLKGPTLELEGRCAILTESRMLLTNCELTFVFADSAIIPSTKPKNVDVTGRLDTRQGKLVFVVTRLTSTPSDLETLRARRAEITTNVPRDWYKLADWAVERGEFYDDDALRDQAQDLYRNGILAESRTLPVTAVEPLITLAEKSREFGLPRSLSEELIHQAVQRQLEAARRDSPPSYAPALTRILESMPGSNRPLVLDDQTRDLQRRYLADPQSVYDAAEPAERLKLHRLLYLDAAQEHIESAAAADGSNGFAIASALEESLPELSARADEFREREIAYQIDTVKTLSREQLLQLVQRLEERDRAARGDEMKRRWLAAQEPRYRQRGTFGRFELADEFLTLTGDRDRAVELLIELHGEREAQQLAADRLVAMGYRFGTDGKWRPADDRGESEFANAIARGVIRAGMTEDQIRAALGGVPEKVVRFASRSGVTELWVYEAHDVSVLMKRRREDQTRIAVEISNIQALPK